MKKIMLIFFFFITTLDIYPIIGTEIKGGYLSNLSGIKDDIGSSYLDGSFYIYKYFEPSKKIDMLTNTNLSFENFFNDTTRDTIYFDTLLGLKLNNPIHTFFFDIAFSSKFFKKENEENNYLMLYLSPHYILDLEDLSLYIDPKIGFLNFPNDIYDKVFFDISSKFLTDINWVYKIVLKIGYTKEYYKEYYLLKTITQMSSEKMNTDIFYFNLNMEYMLSAYINLFLETEVRKTKSNGNYLFYGPNEDTLILDGDEQIINDYFSNIYYSANFQLEYNFSNGRIYPSISYKYENYNRPPQNSSQLFETSKSLYISTINFSIGIKLFISKKLNTNIIFSLNNKSSNDYFENVSFYDFSLSIDYTF